MTRRDMTKLIENPVWRKANGGPMICPVTMLPAMDSLQDLLAFVARVGPGVTITRYYQCPHCSKFHCDTVARDPAGATSGTTRHAKHSDDP